MILTCWYSSWYNKMRGHYFILLRYMKVLEIFETIDSEYKNVFPTFLYDFLCVRNFTIASQFFKSIYFTVDIAFTGLKWAKKSLLYLYTQLKWNFARMIRNSNLITRREKFHKQMTPNFFPEATWFQAVFPHRREKYIYDYWVLNLEFPLCLCIALMFMIVH